MSNWLAMCTYDDDTGNEMWGKDCSVVHIPTAMARAGMTTISVGDGALAAIAEAPRLAEAPKTAESADSRAEK